MTRPTVGLPAGYDYVSTVEFLRVPDLHISVFRCRGQDRVDCGYLHVVDGRLVLVHLKVGGQGVGYWSTQGEYDWRGEGLKSELPVTQAVIRD